MLPPVSDRAKLADVLDRLAAAVEELMLGGLTTTTEATRQALGVTLQEAARFRLLRLGSTLRGAGEELGRYTRSDPAFSRKRLAFFLNRAWVLCRGLGHALRANDEATYDRLSWNPPSVSLPELRAVCLGAVKRVATGAFVAFEFRLRALEDLAPVAIGRRLTWSTIFPLKPGMDIPAEGFLHLSQKQKFVANQFLAGTELRIKNATLSSDESGLGRITLLEQSTVEQGPAFGDWSRFLGWSPAESAARALACRPGPLDLETELTEEIVLDAYEIGNEREGEEPGQSIIPLTSLGLEFQIPTTAGPESKALKKSLAELKKAKKARPPLYALLHYERSRFILQPLTAFTPKGPEYLTISKEIINKAELLKAMSFN